MLTTPKELYKVNKKLSESIRQIPWLYAFFISIFCIIISLLIVHLFLNSIELNSLIGIIFFIVFFDMIATLTRLANRAFIKPYHLIAFPISTWKKFQYHWTILLIDIKTLIYLSTMVCFIFFFIQKGLYLGALLSLLVWFLLFTNVLTWTAVLYSFFFKYVDKMGDKIHYIAIIIFLIIYSMNELIDDFMTRVPVLKQAGTSLYGLWTNDPQIVWENLSILLGSLGLPLILLFGVSRFTWNR